MLDRLDRDERGEAEHGRATVQKLGARPERTQGSRVALLPEQHGDERGPGEEGGRGEDEVRLVFELLQDRLARRQLGADGGDEGEHAEPAVDDLGLGLEGHGLCERVGEEGGDLRGRDGG